MGDLQDWSPELNGGVVTEDNRPVVSSVLPSLSCNHQNTPAIDAGCWEIAEEVADEIISHVQPTVLSERRRKDVIAYVQRLIRDCLGCEVFQFGSVPLHTYLPDGDIDLTIFGVLNFEDALANDVLSVLLGEEQNPGAEFVVKDVQLITAEVKLVKCLVQNIVVDISFNQLGGLSTLCFLEKVDNLIGKSNLFKRSIILIKAWCFYESRILGAHHGLISTYGLETLVLYIFHRFHSSLNGPLAVLYKFLEHFTKFDWDNYCISLNGPIRISSLPQLVVEMPENGGGDLLLSNEFLRDSMEMFAVPPKVSEAPSKTFLQKHLNIVDPLRENNNLGRSVSRGNFYRIQSAFNFGARKLGHILSLPEHSLPDEVCKFFSNTLERHGKDLRPDVLDPIPLPRQNGIALALPSLEIESCQANESFSELGSTYLEESFCNGINNVQILSKEMELNRSMNESERGSMRVVTPSPKLLEGESDANKPTVSGFRLSGDAKDLATPRLHDLKIFDHASMSSVGKSYPAPHLYCSPLIIEDKEMVNGTQVTDEVTETTVCNHDDETTVSTNDVLNSVPVDEPVVHLNNGYQEMVSEAQGSLQSLSGDYGNHFYNLQYGRWLYDYALCGPIPQMPRPMISRFPGQEPWESRRLSPAFSPDMLPHNGNGLIRQPAFYPRVNQMIIPGPPFGMEEKPKPRGTGTYFPNTNHYRERSSNQRWRNQAPIRSPRNNGHAAMFHQEINLIDRSNGESSQSQLPLLQGGGYHQTLYFPPADSPGSKLYSNSNRSLVPVERSVEVARVATSPPLDSSTQPVHDQSLVQNPNLNLQIPQMPSQESVEGINQDKVTMEPYQLKDEDDFPPLSA